MEYVRWHGGIGTMINGFYNSPSVLGYICLSSYCRLVGDEGRHGLQARLRPFLQKSGFRLREAYSLIRHLLPPDPLTYSTIHHPKFVNQVLP